ncbi:helicase-related protein [Parvularcula sp. LCG005]|uniref:helicase-related protein n=1 Tax=Parvularcula sp. LCG005 TaxID=3078805 RepID=UPI002941FE35|nr:helicase-related protein [Parvularcula sp. LCG005]WOI54197.1 helicase-related protein [Parvularcula sp. LCG005]
MPSPFSPTSSLVIEKPITAVLGPTNTGKTHFALERMSAHSTGMIGLPLRLLAREVYDKMVERKGVRAVALVTGEEKIIPPSARYWICTVEAMPLERKVSFLAIDEVQLAADAERGRIFTDRLLHARGQHETLFLGSDTMIPILKRLVPDIGFVSRERFSTLEYIGHKKVTRLPRRSAIVAFSADSVYSIAELIRRQRGGAAVVMGALSPRTRNAQADLYNNGEVDYLVATDAIGMGLNMDIDHVAFAAGRKFDGRNARFLYPAEVGQIAGRAGRHIRNGTWGPTADCGPFNEELIEQVEDHRFEAVHALQWRNPNLQFQSVPALLNSLETKPPREELVRARMDDDEDALRRLLHRHDIRDSAKGGAALKLLWEVCQVPDFRKVTPDQHAVMLGEIYHQLLDGGQIPEPFTAAQLEKLNRLDGDVDALSNRIAHVRTWTYLSHRPGWLERAGHWQDMARGIEDALSDALHEKLTQRFIDRRTSVLLKKLKDDEPLLAGVTEDGEVIVEGEFVGRLLGFQFILDPRAKGPHAKAVRFAALKALRPELAARAAALAAAQFHEFSLREGGTVWWRQSVIATLSKGPQPLRPNFKLEAVEHLPPQSLPLIEERVRDFIADRVENLAGPLVSLQKAVNEVSESPEALGPKARGVAFRLVENFGAISRNQISGDVKALEQDERAKLRKLGIRFGEYTLHMPALLKPAPAHFLALLWALWEDKDPDAYQVPQAGATSVPNDKETPAAFYFASGYRPSGNRAVRIDMLERLAGEVRTARDASGREGFEGNAKMMSLVGCSGEDFESILQSLGFKKATITREVPKAKLLKKSAETAEEPSAAEAAPAPNDSGDMPAEQIAESPAISTAIVDDHAAPPAVPQTDDAEAATAPATGEAAEAVSGEAAPAEATTAETTTAQPAEEPVETETVEVTVWRWMPPRPKADRRPRGKPQAARGAEGEGQKGPRKGGKPKFEGKGEGRGKGPRKGGKPQDKGPRTFSSERPRREKEPDPNSPFAVLAALKGKD